MIDSDSSSSSSSSSSDDEDDAASIDSNEIGPIRLDESVCPNGCDSSLYELTFTLRSKRHQMEESVRNEQKSIENSRKEIDFLTTQIRVVEQELNVNKEKLASFRVNFFTFSYKNKFKQTVFPFVERKTKNAESSRDFSHLKHESNAVFSK